MIKKTISFKFLRPALYALFLALTIQSCKKSDTGAHVVNVTTFAGDTTAGFAEGTGTAARFTYPEGVTTDAAGNVYVADTYNSRIRKITPGGVVTTLAGNGIPGFKDTIGAFAQFNFPLAIATDAAGNVYVAEYISNCIRKITPTGVVSTLAGSSTVGFVNATGTAARFNRPSGVTVDASGNVYVGDLFNNCIRKITSQGVVTTYAGTGIAGFKDSTALLARFNGPSGMAIDALGNIYVAEQGNNRIRKITPTGIVSTLAGSGAAGFKDSTGTLAMFNVPFGVATDAAGNVYVADFFNNRIRKITAGGVVTTLAGSGAPGFLNATGDAAMFKNPSGVTTDAAGNVYVADYGNNCIRKIR
jgi:sugar lactone lactonase YvrE